MQDDGASFKLKTSQPLEIRRHSRCKVVGITSQYGSPYTDMASVSSGKSASKLHAKAVHVLEPVPAS